MNGASALTFELAVGPALRGVTRLEVGDLDRVSNMVYFPSILRTVLSHCPSLKKLAVRYAIVA